MKDAVKAAIKTSLADMGISQDNYRSLEIFVKNMQEIRENDVIIRKESLTTIKIIQ